MASTTHIGPQARAAAVLDDGKFLTFNLAREQYGIGILKVREIMGMMPFTPVPRTPDFVKGVINLRGKVIPVVDLRLKFGLPQAAYGERTCIIVVAALTAAGLTPMGIVVDSVSEVANIRPEQVEGAPAFGVELDTEFIMGMAKVGQEVKILLDIDRVLNEREPNLVARAAQKKNCP